MTNWELIAEYSLASAMLIIMLLGILFSIFMPVTDRWSKRYFIILFSILFLISVICFSALLFWEDRTMASVERIIYFLEGLFLPTTMFMPTLFLLHRCGERVMISKLFIIVMELCGLDLIVLIIAQFTDAFYFVTEDNYLYRNILFPLLMAPLVIIMILNLVALFRRRKKLSKKCFYALLLYMLPMAVAVFFHMFTSIEIFIVSCMAMFALVMFGLILSDNMDQYLQQQKKIANQRASIMILQMRPHFIYNTMTGIYYLCDQDPSKAKQVTLDFTTYLRKNFAAIASEDTILFRDELEHTRAYLAVEQAQFEDILFVSFDTPHTMFRVPPLTLQPLVENAVKHGMKSDSDPIHISIVTRKTDTSYEIIVEDDGIGFSPAHDNDPHIALDNIIRRLELVCKGQLAISPREGGGTSVKVTIPISED